jgi:hypothetical protein
MAKTKARSVKTKRKTTARLKDLAPKPASARMVAGGLRRPRYITST